MKDFETRKLNFQLVPSTCWYKNVRSIIPNWNEVSNYIRRGCKCSICNAIKPISELHAHEVWQYNDTDHTQHLKEIICVCEACHNSIHIGYANTQGIGDIAIKHYKEVNNLDYETVRKDYDEAFHVWEERSKFKWTLSEHEILKRVEELTGINCDLTNSVNGRFYANVPYYDKDNAKTFGAKWDPERKMWYFMSEEARKNWYDCEDH